MAMTEKCLGCKRCEETGSGADRESIIKCAVDSEGGENCSDYDEVPPQASPHDGANEFQKRLIEERQKDGMTDEEIQRWLQQL